MPDKDKMGLIRNQTNVGNRRVAGVRTRSRTRTRSRGCDETIVYVYGNVYGGCDDAEAFDRDLSSESASGAKSNGYEEALGNKGVAVSEPPLFSHGRSDGGLTRAA